MAEDIAVRRPATRAAGQAPRAVAPTAIPEERPRVRRVIRASSQERAGEVPAWKRIDVFGGALPEPDRQAVEASDAGTMSLNDSRTRLERGET